MLGRSHKPEFGEGADPSPATTSVRFASIVAMMTAEHRWSDCRPAILTRSGGDTVEGRRLQTLVERVWPTISEDDRRAFHRFTCQNSRSTADLAAMERIAETLRFLANAR